MEQEKKLEFKEYTKGIRDKSSVWNFFLRTSDGVHAECKRCKKVIKCRNTTTCLHNHLKLHPASLPASLPASHHESPVVVPTSSTSDEPKKKIMKINEYFKPPQDDMKSMVAKMAACDGFPFSIFSTSDSIRKLFKKSGYDDLPKSSNSIKKIVVQKSEELKTELKAELNRLKAKGYKFATSLDEWTSPGNRRYMNVNIHSPYFEGKCFRNLGLTRITGRGTASRCAEILKDKLASFDLSVEKDIACAVTDGASVMCAMGRQLPSYHQLCFAHGIQCAILDVIYKKNSNDQEIVETAHPTEEETEEDDSSESEFEEEGFTIDQNANRNIWDFQDVDVKNAIEKVRKVVKFFKKSPTRCELLNNYLHDDQKKMGLILDCKTRWSSLADMISRFLTLKDATMKVLIDLKNDITFSPTELALLRELSTSLNIVKTTVEAICEEKANLLTAETALEFMVAKLESEGTFTGEQLLKALKIRIAQRRLSDLVCTLKYLHSPSKYYAEPSSIFFPSPGNNVAITQVIVEINANYFCEMQETSDDEDNLPLIHHQQRRPQIEDPRGSNEPDISFKEQLKKKIEETISASSTSTSTAKVSDREELEISIRMQMAVFDRGGPRQVYLNQAYEFLLCIPPSSVECERVFSSTKYICNHLRSALNDDSINALSFLRSHFQRKN